MECRRVGRLGRQKEAGENGQRSKGVAMLQEAAQGLLYGE
jgi:hypothetical protein